MPDVQIIAVDRRQAQNIGDPNSLGLRRKELTPDAKRWQLWGKGVKGVEADEIIERLYGPQP